jgi:hypothetical protein
LIPAKLIVGTATRFKKRKVSTPTEVNVLALTVKALIVQFPKQVFIVYEFFLLYEEIGMKCHHILIKENISDMCIQKR